MKILGIDIGSTTTKLAIFEESQLSRTQLVTTMSFYRDYCLKANGQIQVNLDKLELPAMDKIISTGYGRNNVRLTNTETINELKAHCYGAMYTTGLKTFTLLDIGGQDSKVIRVEKGIIVDLDLNDKCAASSGRFLENMARVLEVDLDWLTNQYQNPVSLNNTCAIFGESELIGKIAAGHNLEELAAGVNFSLFKRIEALLKKFPRDLLLFTGGVSYNLAMRRFLEQLGYGQIIVPDNAQLNGAIGCCYYGVKF